MGEWHLLVKPQDRWHSGHVGAGLGAGHNVSRTGKDPKER